MTGAYQTWQYGPAGWIVDLNEYIQDPAKTNPNYNWDDVLPNLRASTAWSGVPGAALGGGGAKQWAVPWGFELNSIAYNRSIFEQVGIKPPKNLPELVETRPRSPRTPAAPTASACAARAPGPHPPGLPLGLRQLRRSDFTVDGRQAARRP